MSGHSKWSTIKNKKGKADAARGKIFTKIGRELAVAVKLGGPDPASNSRLRDVIAKAKANNMPNDNINRSIKKASGELGSINYEELTYEGYGIGGVAVIVETMTDNKNRTVGEVRHAFDKFGGSLGTNGSVAFMFDKKGVIVIDTEAGDEDSIMEAALEAGAEDFSAEDGAYEITTAPEDFSAVREALEGQGYEFLSAEIDMVPQTMTSLSEEQQKQFEKMLDMLEDNDDVQNVYHNADMPDGE
ncbi:YebC/PmpR family DNA-binding transcriptional regulator [Christensenella tenuis]|uniref:Probable transcriptional regulatory protein H8S18_07020 n=1 Tax=Christensenella tenuis TaxID=2763033 RepID=A0ABR7EE71_9FIRM|nr:YebC/PmpR family DNA-binding transcriptional regulator [Christensenella tenuis]MBC5648085.1 YebC/PmpR family DNA-binding transcriptional regulator [Christensenella tenuis]